MHTKYDAHGKMNERKIWRKVGKGQDDAECEGGGG